MNIKETKEKILEALEDKKTISINPPPQDGNCYRCGKNVKDLKPFGKAGDPLVGDFDGALLVKTFRTMGPNDEKLNKELKEVKDWDKFFKENPKKAEQLSFYDQLRNTVSASWECRDCIILDDDEVEYYGAVK